MNTDLSQYNYTKPKVLPSTVPVQPQARNNDRNYRGNKQAEWRVKEKAQNEFQNSNSIQNPRTLKAAPEKTPAQQPIAEKKQAVTQDPLSQYNYTRKLEQHAVLPNQAPQQKNTTEGTKKPVEKKPREKINRGTDVSVQLDTSSSEKPRFVKLQKIQNMEPSRIDVLGFAAVLGNDQKSAESHMHKRLELFECICHYIEEKKPFLADYRYPNKDNKNEFGATQFFVPSDYQAKKGFERVHISIFNKIVLINMKNKKLYRVEGEITFKGKKIELDALLNTCDGAPKVMNLVDGMMEHSLRKLAKVLINDILLNKKTAETTMSEFKGLYCTQMNALKVDLEIGRKHSVTTARDTHERERIEILNNILDYPESSLRCVNGMLVALEGVLKL